MKKIDPFKPRWNTDDWNIYIGNLEILCRKYGLKKQDLNKKCGVFNAFRTDINRPAGETIEKIAEKFGVNTKWLLTQNEKIITISEPENVYDPHGGWKPRSIEELVGVPEGMGMGRAVEMLARIYQSKNQSVISAIYSNLRVSCERVAQDDEIATLKREMAELRELIKNNAKVHGYYGEDRRSGIERRQHIGASPTGTERRSGEDRRKSAEENENTHEE